MNTLEKVKVYLDSIPEKLFHILVVVPAVTGPLRKNDMDIDAPTGRKRHRDDDTVDERTVGEAVAQLTALIRIKDANENEPIVLSATESRDATHHSSPAATGPIQGACKLGNILKLDIQTRNNVPSFLSAERIFRDERCIGISMPIDKLLKVRAETVVLVGVSGCGKTRTCNDFARHTWCLYFDCAKEFDFLSMIKMLERVVPASKSLESQQAFEDISEKLLLCLLSARLIVLQVFRTKNLDSFEWFCIQRSRRVQNQMK
ncbi:hypothetical protein HDU81_006299 [Chytriomyces hyalinus]|nr:hypothetical protein HDU81_006299 [Chytriomyces hyalinus]